MDELQDVLKQHAMIMKATTALFYGILVSIAMNFFWEPGISIHPASPAWHS